MFPQVRDATRDVTLTVSSTTSSSCPLTARHRHLHPTPHPGGQKPRGVDMYWVSSGPGSLPRTPNHRRPIKALYLASVTCIPSRSLGAICRTSQSSDHEPCQYDRVTTQDVEKLLGRRGSRGQTILSCFVCNVVIVTPSESVPSLRGCLTAFTRALGGLSCGRLEWKNPGVLYIRMISLSGSVSGFLAGVLLSACVAVGWPAWIIYLFIPQLYPPGPRPQAVFGHEDRPRSIVLRSISA